jgi:hypothetical protein
MRFLISRSRWSRAQHVKEQKSAYRGEGEEVCTGVTRDLGKVKWSSCHRLCLGKRVLIGFRSSLQY